MNNDIMNNDLSKDKIHIADEVLANIAALSVGKVPSIIPSTTGVGEGLAGFLGMKNPSKGIKVETSESGVSIDVYVNMEYGCKINAVGKQLQNTVREDLEEMTGLKVLQVNVHVLSINAKDTQRDIKALRDAKENKDYKNIVDVKDIIDIEDKSIIDEGEL